MRRIALTIALVAAFLAAPASAQTRIPPSYQALGQSVAGTSASGTVVDPCAFLNSGANTPSAETQDIKLKRDECTARYGSWRKCLECMYNPSGSGCQ
jgi:hypothetical protein